MSDLVQKKCMPCRSGTSPLDGASLMKLYQELGSDWKLVNNHHVEKIFSFKNFRQALEFTNKVGELAEEQGHHPDIALAWGKVGITLWTHAAGGLTENDFILAAKIDVLCR